MQRSSSSSASSSSAEVSSRRAPSPALARRRRAAPPGQPAERRRHRDHKRVADPPDPCRRQAEVRTFRRRARARRRRCDGRGTRTAASAGRFRCVADATPDAPLTKPLACAIRIGASSTAAAAAALSRPARARRRQRDQDRPDRQQRPLLVGDRHAEREPGQHRALTICQQHGEHAQRAAEQFLGVADFDRAHRDRVGCAQAERRLRATAAAVRRHACAP